jgi:hypothetical protein
MDTPRTKPWTNHGKNMDEKLTETDPPHGPDRQPDVPHTTPSKPRNGPKTNRQEKHIAGIRRPYQKAHVPEYECY